MPNSTDLVVDVETPSGELLLIDDPILIRKLEEGSENGLTLLRSDRAMTIAVPSPCSRCRPDAGWDRNWGSTSTNGASERTFTWTSRPQRGLPRMSWLVGRCASAQRPLSQSWRVTHVVR